jgi:hypothetical protein
MTALEWLTLETSEWLTLETSFNLVTSFVRWCTQMRYMHQIYDQLGIPDHSVDMLVFNMLDESKTSLAYERK